MLEGSTQGEFFVGDKRYDLHVADLPCTVETHKTLDNQHYFKNGNVGQVLLVTEPDTDIDSLVDYDGFVTAGITPASNNIRTERWQNLLPTPVCLFLAIFNKKD